ncbi:MAG: hypothetical protein ABIF88_01520 [archaeon]
MNTRKEKDNCPALRRDERETYKVCLALRATKERRSAIQDKRHKGAK